MFDKKEHNEIYRRMDKGGTLFLIERTDTHEFLYDINYMQFSSVGCGNRNYPEAGWTTELCTFKGIEAFLTREDAEKHNTEFREGGCSHCLHGSTIIPTIVTEHEFVPKIGNKR